jgi:hypothetical protein
MCAKYCVLPPFFNCKQSQVVSFTGGRDSFLPDYQISIILVEYVHTLIHGLILVFTDLMVCYINMVSSGSHGIRWSSVRRGFRVILDCNKRSVGESSCILYDFPTTSWRTILRR